MSESYAQLVLDVRDIKTAIVGDMTPQNPGLAHMVLMQAKTQEDIVSMIGDLKERTSLLEAEKNRRVGFIAACAAIGGVIGFFINVGISWLGGKK